MVDGAPPSDVSGNPTQHEDLPDKLRVHSLARALGTSSKRVLDALTELDGRVRSAHSTVDRVDAVRVRDLLAAAPGEPDEPEPAEADEPESRLMLETTVDRPEYMPLFVAPQPVEADPGASDDAGDSDDSDDFDDADVDDEQAERPAGRRRRRGRR
ncbi:translation initiation factor IF-2 N-terminal domain-containing protein, partial [uncultured Mycobacterium sp.]|uniref:translation initiation factor IF-2 N-terminal domain-containing protein n=1 Tax=uncultured Mycobacterium sp. TaxID=171292 RepID=UPI0035CB986F